MFIWGCFNITINNWNTLSNVSNMMGKGEWHLFVCLVLVGFMVLNITYNNISVISCQSALLVEETGGPGENHRPVASHWQTLSHNPIMLYSSPWAGVEPTTSMVIGTDCIGSCKSNYHTIMATTAPQMLVGKTMWFKTKQMCTMFLSLISTFIFHWYIWMTK